jgi:hypothetical protein
VKKALLYHLSVAICGGLIGVLGVSGSLSGNVTVVSVLLAIGGTGMALGAVYETFLSGDPTETVPDDWLVWFTISMAVIVVVAGLLSLLT